MKDIETVNDIRELAGLAPVASTKIDEGVVGGFAPLAANGYTREESELDRWIKLMDDADASQPTNLSESIDEELSELEESADAEEDEEETFEAMDVEASTKEFDKIEEEVEGDFQNGYGEENKTEAYHSDFFPNGATSPVANRAGPASGKHGDNPLQKDMSEVEVDDLTEAKAVYSELVYAYRKFLGE